MYVNDLNRSLRRSLQAKVLCMLGDTFTDAKWLDVKFRFLFKN